MMVTRRGISRFGLALSASLTGGCASIHSVHSTEIERSVETTWAVFSDKSRLEEWLHDFDTMPWADDDPETIGDVTQVTLSEDGEEMVLMQTITSIKENEEFAFNLEHDWMVDEFSFRFEPRGVNACTVEWSTTIRPKGLWPSIWMNMARGSIKARFEEHLDKLRTIVEAEPTG